MKKVLAIFGKIVAVVEELEREQWTFAIRKFSAAMSKTAKNLQLLYLERPSACQKFMQRHSSGEPLCCRAVRVVAHVDLWSL